MKKVKNKYQRNIQFWGRKPDKDGFYSRIPDDTDVKCNKCQITKKTVDFYSAKWCKNGLRSFCKKCYINYIEGYHKDNLYLNSYRCWACNKIKRGYHFYREKYTKRGITRLCKACIRG